MKRGGNESLWWESTEEEGWGVRSNSSQVFIVRNADSRSANSPTERSKIVGRTEREAQIASRNRVSIEPRSGILGSYETRDRQGSSDHEKEPSFD